MEQSEKQQQHHQDMVQSIGKQNSLIKGVDYFFVKDLLNIHVTVHVVHRKHFFYYFLVILQNC